jgi:hypothetical protein
MTPDEVRAMAKRVQVVSEQLAAAVGGLPKLIGPGGADTHIISAIVDAYGEAAVVAKAVKDDFDCHEAGLLSVFAVSLESAAAAIGQYIATSQDLAGQPKITRVVSDLAATARQHAASLRQDAARYEYATGLPAELAEPRRAWFAARLPDPQPGEIRTLLGRMKDGFKTAVEAFAAQGRLEASAAPPDADALSRELEAHVAASPSVTAAIGKGSVQGLLSGKLTALADAGFTARYVSSFCAKNAAILARFPFARLIPLSEVDNVLGVQADGMMYIRAAGSDLSVCVHEAMHQLAEQRTAQAWRKAFGYVMEEAAAEYLCGIICKERKIAYKLAGYYNNVTLLQTIMQHGGLTDSAVFTAYLTGATAPVQQAILKISGPAGLSVLQEATDSYDGYYAWVAEFKKVNPGSSGDCTLL